MGGQLGLPGQGLGGQAEQLIETDIGGFNLAIFINKKCRAGKVLNIVMGFCLSVYRRGNVP